MAKHKILLTVKEYEHLLDTIKTLHKTNAEQYEQIAKLQESLQNRLSPINEFEMAQDVARMNWLENTANGLSFKLGYDDLYRSTGWEAYCNGEKLVAGKESVREVLDVLTKGGKG